MNPLLRFAVYILLTGTVALESCSKSDPVNSVYNYPPVPPPSPPQSPSQQQPLPPFPPVYDSLSGREFLFTNLTWDTWGGSDVEVEIPNSHLFLIRGIEVSIDSSSFWVPVPFYTVEFGIGALPFPVNNGYIYDNNYFDSLFLFAIGANKNQLVGTKVSIRVKVL
jgi:hypothetical protein